MQHSTNGHGGNVHRAARTQSGRIYDFSANINPVGPPDWLRRQVSRSLSDLVHYPDPDCRDLVHAIAQTYKKPEESIIPANGTTELLYSLPFLLGDGRVVLPSPSYIDYRKVPELAGKEIVTVLLSAENGFELDTQILAGILRKGDSVILGRPNNPTGISPDRQRLLDLALSFPDVLFIFDEAFLGFAKDDASLAGCAGNIVTLHSLTKFYAIPGLRLGFGVFPENLAEKMRAILPPWSVNTIAQSVGKRLLEDTAYQATTVRYVTQCRKQLEALLAEFPDLKIFPSCANFLFIQIRNGLSAAALQEKLLAENILIRECDNYAGLDSSYFRVAVRTEEENLYLAEKFSGIFCRKRHGVRHLRRKQPKSLMIQGTCSNAGKSILVTALCRILVQDGLRIAPFKAQNMSLNSFVTRDGKEMGRAQVVQAQAAKLDPDVRMNPVLLKPNSDIGSQVIVMGKPVGNMSVRQYTAYKPTAFQSVQKAYDSLAAEYDAVLLEGAGSPGEVNLKHHDIVNMGMARYSRSPVLIAGDIDRGGVYASFVGTMEVLEEWERRLVAGFLVNKFRGDATLLADAHQYVVEHTGIPVLGTIPYLSEMGIPEEDSVSFCDGLLQKERPLGEHIEIALIELPYLSNFTDMEPFFEEPDVYLHMVSSLEELGTPDAIILPGSKNVFRDCHFLRDSGLGKAICRLARNGCEIVGLCGGYQLLGKTIRDPYSIESDNGVEQGLGLLNIETVMVREKTLLRREGKHLGADLPVSGYEIHHGQTSGELRPVLQLTDNSMAGSSHSTLPVWGSYLHGLFDADAFRRYFIDGVRCRKGLAPLGHIVAEYNVESAIDRLADTVRSAIDMERIYALLEGGL